MADEKFLDEDFEDVTDQVVVTEKKGSLMTWTKKHPTITTIVVSILAALGGYAVGKALNGSEDEDIIDVDSTDVSDDVTVTEF